MVQGPNLIHFVKNWTINNPVLICLMFSYMTDKLGKGTEGQKRRVFGLIESSTGGSGVEAWIPQYALRPCNISPVVNIRKRNKSNSWLFNAMISPLLRLPIYGVLWYQGEKKHIPLDDKN